VQPEAPPKDLIVLVADKNMKAALSGILQSPRLNIRRIELLDLLAHPNNDPGVYRQAHEFLRPFHRQAAHALVLFDRDGCGSTRPREQLESDVETRLAQNGWQERCAVISIEPELENWVWSRSPHVAAALAWEPRELEAWLVEGNRWPQHSVKPPRPKEVVEAALRLKRIPRSSSIYYEIATRVNFEGCTDPAFIKLRMTLARWFPI
jgi:hypothetical protein